MAHGSRAEGATTGHVALCQTLSATSHIPVSPAFLELSEPSIPAAIDHAIDAGATRVVVVPFFLHPGNHTQRDIPSIVGDARTRHPTADIVVSEHFGADDRIASLVAAQVSTAIAGPPTSARASATPSSATPSSATPSSATPSSAIPAADAASELDAMVATMPFAVATGVEIDAADATEVRGGLEWTPERCTIGDAIHGGALMALADSLGAVCAFLNLPPGASTTTIESKTNFFRAVRSGRVEGTSVPLHVGRRTIVVQTDLRDSAGKRVALVTQTQAVVAPEAQ